MCQEHLHLITGAAQVLYFIAKIRGKEPAVLLLLLSGFLG